MSEETGIQKFHRFRRVGPQPRTRNVTPTRNVTNYPRSQPRVIEVGKQGIGSKIKAGIGSRVANYRAGQAEKREFRNEERAAFKQSYRSGRLHGTRQRAYYQGQRDARRLQPSLLSSAGSVGFNIVTEGYLRPYGSAPGRTRRRKGSSVVSQQQSAPSSDFELNDFSLGGFGGQEERPSEERQIARVEFKRGQKVVTYRRQQKPKQQAAGPFDINPYLPDFSY